MSDGFVIQLSGALVGVLGVLSALLLVMFRRGRLKAFNVTVCLAIAAVGMAEYHARVVPSPGERVQAMAWSFLALTLVWGVIGVFHLARTDPPVWRHRST